MFVLRQDLIRPGDVILTRGSSSTAKMITELSCGTFSHAAFLANSSATFESDGGFIRNKVFPRVRWTTIGSENVPIVDVFGNPELCSVFRHPGMNDITPERFRVALEDEFKESFGKDYSQFFRLIQISNLPSPVRSLAAKAMQQFEASNSEFQIPGPFCSELVARLYDRLGLPLFADDRKPEHVSPSDLAESALVEVQDAVMKADDLFIVPNLTLESVLPPAFCDVTAYAQKWERWHGKSLDELNIAVQALHDELKTQNAGLNEGLLQIFKAKALNAAKLKSSAMESQQPAFLRRTERLWALGLEAADELTLFSEQMASNKPHPPPTFSKFQTFCLSVDRCETLLTSSSLKEKIKKAPPSEKRQLINMRTSLLKGIRSSITFRLKMNSEMQQFDKTAENLFKKVSRSSH